jgi:hypothetical protein
MSNSGPGFHADAELRVAVPYPLILKILRELNNADERQHALSEEIINTLPSIMVARVEFNGERERHQ